MIVRVGSCWGLQGGWEGVGVLCGVWVWLMRCCSCAMRCRYNELGGEGGKAVGASLQYLTSLQELRIS